MDFGDKEAMEINDIKLQIKSGNFDRLFIFCGDEQKIARIYIDKIAEKANLSIQFADSILDVYSNMRRKSLFSEPTMYVILDDKEFLTNERAWEAIGDGQDFKDDIVVFWYTSHDKRLKFWKHFQNRAVEFNKLDNEWLKKYIRRELELNDKNCQKLIEACDGDYGRILLEIDKIRQYANTCIND